MTEKLCSLCGCRADGLHPIYGAGHTWENCKRPVCPGRTPRQEWMLVSPFKDGFWGKKDPTK